MYWLPKMLKTPIGAKAAVLEGIQKVRLSWRREGILKSERNPTGGVGVKLFYKFALWKKFSDFLNNKQRFFPISCLKFCCFEPSPEYKMFF